MITSPATKEGTPLRALLQARRYAPSLPHHPQGRASGPARPHNPTKPIAKEGHARHN